MSDFKSLQSIWTNQEVEIQKPSEEVIRESNRLQRKLINGKRWTVAILSTTILICVSFMLYISAYKFTQVFIGIGLMISSLSVRVVIELVSMQRFQKIKEIVSFRECSKDLLKFYQWRKRVSFVFVPIIFALYVIGFIMLLPSFKESLSTGFYNYILFSGIGILLFFVFYIRKQVLSEIQIIKQLTEKFSDKDL